MYRETGRQLKTELDELVKIVENQEVFEENLFAKEKELLQLNGRIGQLQQQILDDNEDNSTARESQANFLQQDIENFIRDVAGIRANVFYCTPNMDPKQSLKSV